MIRKIIKFIVPPFIKEKLGKSKWQYKFISKINNKKKFRNDLKEFNRLYNKHSNNRFEFNKDDLFPCIYDNTNTTEFDRQYVYHTSWAIRVLKKINPECHIDISSSLFFIGLASAYTRVKYYDYRPPNLELDNLSCDSIDINNLPFENNSVESMSCLHVIEHIGLGRYGDELDVDGDVNAIEELKKKIAKGGNLLIVLPVGKPKVFFNAHRVYSYEQVLSYFKEFELEEFVLIPELADDGGLVSNPSKEILDKQNFACGCFWFVKS